MADALLSPAVGGAFWVASAWLIGHSARKIADEDDETRVPLMGVIGAFVFAAQMINFTIPGTGSSGHLGGGLLLAVLLGPYRAFITLASVVVIQCLFFADGGLLALGCNVFNLGFFPVFVAYPLIYRKIAGFGASGARLGAASISAAVAAMLMGAFLVVVQTVLSGVSSLPFDTFLVFMLPIHAAIGLVEGLVTWGVLRFVSRVQPGMLAPARSAGPSRALIAAFAVAALVVGGILSWYASSHPDGLEWSIAQVTGAPEPARQDGGLHGTLAGLQAYLAVLPDYAFRPSAPADSAATDVPDAAGLGTSVSGLIGSLLVVVLAGAAGLAFRSRPGKSKTNG